MNILIIGKGFVGDAVGFVLSKIHTIFWHDPAKNEHYDISILDDIDGVILCLPTPADDYGSCDDSLILQYYGDIRAVSKTLHILIKSTTSIETLNMLQCEDDEYLTFSPEFLVANNSRDDMFNAPFFIYSSTSITSKEFWVDIFRGCVKNIENSIYCDSMVEAGFVKYAINSFLAIKVTFMNEVYDLFNIMTNNGGNFNNVVALMSMDKRIGSSHMQVPGPDGKYGWGGACLPKDTSEFSNLAGLAEMKFTVLDSAIQANRTHRIKDIT